jgi:siroheme synthase-like protein
VGEAEARRDLEMSYYPIMLDVKGKRCVVIGGGQVALRKARVLLECGAAVEIISPELCPGLEELASAGSVKAVLRPYRHGDLQGAALVIAAADDSEVNRGVSEEASASGVLVNVVDVPGLSSFIVPSSLSRGDVTIAVSTNGKSPALARRIRTELEQSFGEEYSLLASLVAEVRSDLKQEGIAVAADVWQEALDLDALLELLRSGRRDEARQRLSESLRKHG